MINDESKWSKPPYRYDVHIESSGIGTKKFYTRQEDMIKDIDRELNHETSGKTIIIRKSPND